MINESRLVVFVSKWRNDKCDAIFFQLLLYVCCGRIVIGYYLHSLSLTNNIGNDVQYSLRLTCSWRSLYHTHLVFECSCNGFLLTCIATKWINQIRMFKFFGLMFFRIQITSCGSICINKFHSCIHISKDAFVVLIFSQRINDSYILKISKMGDGWVLFYLRPISFQSLTLGFESGEGLEGL